MNPGGLVLMILGAIAISQLFAGDALKRLRILPDSAGSAPTPSLTPPLYGGAEPFGMSGAAPDPAQTPMAI